jgi:hypothetical protein
MTRRRRRSGKERTACAGLPLGLTDAVSGCCCADTDAASGACAEAGAGAGAEASSVLVLALVAGTRL